MALTFDISNRESISLPQCIELIKHVDDVHDRSIGNIARLAEILKKLANNRTFLRDMINKELTDLPNLDDFQHGNPFPQQVISLGGGPGFWLRANIWPPTNRQHPKDWERSLFSYLKPHDHDSGFLTVGYWGPGYETDIHEYDPTNVVGYSGEPVALQFLERTILNEGRVMYYRANRDIHTQMPPDEYSVSINLLIQKPGRSSAARQFWFDIERGKIDAPILRPDLTATMFLCRLARSLGSERCVETLSTILCTHYNAYIRTAALEALLEADPRNAIRYRDIASADPNPVVRRSANMEGRWPHPCENLP